MKALIEDTYVAFCHWDMKQSVRNNLKRIQDGNLIGAANESRLKKIVTTLSRRFNQGDIDITPLVLLAKDGFPIDRWKYCLLWHIGNTDELYCRFSTEWLFENYKADTHLFRTKDVIPFVRSITNRSESGIKRVASGILHTACEFGLISGRSKRQFESFHLPDESFLYILYAMTEQETNTHRMLHSPYWQLYLMSPDSVEWNLFRLHQYRKLEYDVAGSLAHLKLPCSSLIDYVMEIIS